MKIEKINENKIKVLIDIDEAKEWNVNIKNIASNTPEIQEMFWTALRLAEKDVEFSVDGAKLFVEAIPGQTEGFGMLITKIFSDNDLNLAVSNCSYKGRVKKRKLTPGRNECIKRALGKRIFRFCDFENVCQAASAVYRDFEGESTLYKLEDSYYMLLLPTDSSSIIGIEKVMLEFSDKQSKTLISHGRLNELGEIMIKENAVNILSEYFSYDNLHFTFISEFNYPFSEILLISDDKIIFQEEEYLDYVLGYSAFKRDREALEVMREENLKDLESFRNGLL